MSCELSGKVAVQWLLPTALMASVSPQGAACMQTALPSLAVTAGGWVGGFLRPIRQLTNVCVHVWRARVSSLGPTHPTCLRPAPCLLLCSAAVARWWREWKKKTCRRAVGGTEHSQAFTPDRWWRAGSSGHGSRAFLLTTTRVETDCRHKKWYAMMHNQRQQNGHPRMQIV